MTDATIMYFCELCGGSVQVDDVPDGVDIDSPVYACETCLPVSRLPISLEQKCTVAGWIWGREHGHTGRGDAP